MFLLKMNMEIVIFFFIFIFENKLINFVFINFFNFFGGFDVYIFWIIFVWVRWIMLYFLVVFVINVFVGVKFLYSVEIVIFLIKIVCIFFGFFLNKFFWSFWIILLNLWIVFDIINVFLLIKIKLCILFL